MKNKRHLLFYDGECGFCDAVVSFVLKQDKNKLFMFAPLQGKTAEKMLADLPPTQKDEDSVILIEDYQTTAKRYILGKAALRVLWLLGGVWTIPGALHFLPSFFYDGVYRLVARNRKKMMKKRGCSLRSKEDKERFLD